jgi:hypothetical protein
MSWSAGSESQPCSSKAAVYEDSSCLARKVAVGSGICGRPSRRRDGRANRSDGQTCSLLMLYSLLYIRLYRKLACCIRPKIAV